MDLLIDDQLIAKTSDSYLRPADFIIDFMDDSIMQICNYCQYIQAGSSIKFIWTKNYAQIASVEVDYAFVPGEYSLNKYKLQGVAL